MDDDKNSPQYTYGTKNEILFIDRLTAKVAAGVILMTRLQVLQTYARALAMRTDWGDIDAAKVQAHLAKAMREELAKNRGYGIVAVRT